MKRERNLSSSKKAFTRQTPMAIGILLTALFFMASLVSGCSSEVSEKSPNGAAGAGSKASSSALSVQASEHLTTTSQPAVSVSEGSLVSPSKSDSSDSATKDDSKNPDCTESDSPSETDGYASPEDTEKFLQDVLEQLDSYEDSLR